MSPADVLARWASFGSKRIALTYVQLLLLIAGFLFLEQAFDNAFAGKQLATALSLVFAGFCFLFFRDARKKDR